MKNNEFDVDTEILPDAVKCEIIESIKRTSFGEVVITIHDSRVVQIEKREKKRFF